MFLPTLLVLEAARQAGRSEENLDLLVVLLERWVKMMNGIHGKLMLP